jgi:type I restriction enzyme S subunit
MKQGWEIKKLGEIVDIINGKNQSQVISEDGKYPIYGSGGNIMGYASDYICEKGTTIIGRKGNISNPIFINERFWNVDTAFGIYPKSQSDPKFIHYLCQTIDFKSRNKGTTIPSLVKSDLQTIEIPFPKSLPEQQRIVSILDEAFAAIAKAKANAEQNLRNAKELFESYLQGVFENKGEGWEEKKLGEVCSLITKGSSPKWQGIRYVDKAGILFVTSENVGEGELILDNRKYVEEKFNQKDKKSILQKGDVLTNIVGASIGRTAIYTIDDIANINQAVCILRCRKEVISNIYLMNLLNSPFLKVILHSNEVNTARANLSLGFFNNLSIPLPSIEVQQTIVQKLDALSAETKRLEAIYQQKIDDLEEMKKSILQKAFSGELRTT